MKLKNISNIADYYEIGNCIGQGSYGKVHIVIQKATQNVMALKILQKESLKSTEKEIEVLQEMNLLKNLDHPNIIKVYELLQDAMNYYIVTELLYGGTLKEKIETTKFNEEEAAAIAKQMFSAINYLHQNRIMHRDLKPQNILFQDEKSGIVKLIDFGYAIQLKEGEFQNKRMGTPFYMAPEVVGKQNYDEKCDVWSLGIIIYYMLTGVRPYDGETTIDIFNSILHNKFEKSKDENKLSQEAIKLIYKMIERDQVKRISIKEAFQSEWISNNCVIPQCSKNCLLNIKENFEELKKIYTQKQNNSFNFEQIFKEFIKKFITLQVIDHSEFPKVQKSFQALDQEGVGYVQKCHLLQAYQMLNEFKQEGNAEDIVENIFMQIGSDKLSYSEFFLNSLKMKHIISPSHLKHCFNLLINSGCKQVNIDYFIKNILDYKQNPEIYYKQFEDFLQTSIFKNNIMVKKEFLSLFQKELELLQLQSSEQI